MAVLSLPAARYRFRMIENSTRKCLSTLLDCLQSLLNSLSALAAFLIAKTLDTAQESARALSCVVSRAFQRDRGRWSWWCGFIGGGHCRGAGQRRCGCSRVTGQTRRWRTAQGGAYTSLWCYPTLSLKWRVVEGGAGDAGGGGVSQ
jgi:hypothetical protein